MKCHTPSPVDFRREQDANLKLQKWIKRNLNTDWPFHPELVNAGETIIWVDTKVKQPRILVPTSLQHSAVFSTVFTNLPTLPLKQVINLSRKMSI